MNVLIFWKNEIDIDSQQKKNCTVGYRNKYKRYYGPGRCPLAYSSMCLW